jgi:polysaccharide export outer membrane protein
MKHWLHVISIGLLLANQVVSAEQRYLVNAGDVLDISVWNEDALQKEVIVLPDGMISFPLAGELLAKGNSVTNIQKVISEKLTEYISDPVVTVSVISVSGNSINIMGKVTNPGSFIMTRPLDVVQALSLAGGLSPYAEEDDIKVLRRTNNTQQVLPVDISAIKQGKKLESNILLKSGDVIIIP